MRSDTGEDKLTLLLLFDTSGLGLSCCFSFRHGCGLAGLRFAVSRGFFGRHAEQSAWYVLLWQDVGYASRVDVGKLRWVVKGVVEVEVVGKSEGG